MSSDGGTLYVFVEFDIFDTKFQSEPSSFSSGPIEVSIDSSELFASVARILSKGQLPEILSLDELFDFSMNY